jgi:hypothetical protein
MSRKGAFIFRIKHCQYSIAKTYTVIQHFKATDNRKLNITRKAKNDNPFTNILHVSIMFGLS